MLTFGLNYDVKPEHVEEFLKITRQVLNAMPSFEGHVHTVMYSDIDKPNSFMIYSEWESNEVFKGFIGSKAFKDVQNMSSDMLENRPRHKVYEAKKMH
ncbi:MAG: antibiotic biosynthesis monooxygenase [Candidatus Sericytochromatia bacterium]|nr:antibiotic biosynthesis monooxygenase [Candidatus Sericytochromatia bacterium]